MNNIQETIILILCALLGVILHLSMQFYDEINGGGLKGAVNKFNWTKEIAEAIIGLLGISSLIFFRNEIKEILPMTKFLAFIYGLASDKIPGFLKTLIPKKLSNTDETK